MALCEIESPRQGGLPAGGFACNLERGLRRSDLGLGHAVIVNDTCCHGPIKELFAGLVNALDVVTIINVT